MKNILSNQLRQSHFHLGAHPSQPLSTYLRDYPPKLAQPPLPVSFPKTVYMDHAGSAANNMYISQNTLKFNNLSGRAISQRKPTNNLRAHHYTLGNDKQDKMVTTAQYYFNAKAINNTAGLSSSAQKNKMRSHNHVFDEADKTKPLSNYKLNFLPKKCQKIEHSASASNIRSSHILFGKSQNQFVSNQMQNFQRKQALQTVLSVPNFKPLELGSCQPDFITTNNKFFPDYGPAQPYKFGFQKLQTLRGTHFSIGRQPTKPMQSQHQANFKPLTGQNSIRKHVPIPDTANILSENQKGNRFQTYYNSTMRKYTKCNAEPVVYDMRTNFSLGKHNSPLSTQSIYTKKGINPLIQAAGIVSNDKPGDYDTLRPQGPNQPIISIQKLDYTPKKVQRPTLCRKKEERQEKGKEGRVQATEYMDEYRPEQNNKLMTFHARMYKPV